jgi:hypothetical protein
MKWFYLVSCRISVNKICLKFSLIFVFSVYSLEPYTLNAKELLADEAVRKCLMKISIITDKQRLHSNNAIGVVQPEERNAEGIWYYSETTKNFDKLPMMYKGKNLSAERL